MATVAACYVYPVKGLTPALAPALEVEAGGAVRGDRAFVFAFADAKPRGPGGWVSKHQSVTLLNTPRLAEIEAAWDDAGRRLSLRYEAATAQARVDDEREREALAQWLADVVQGWPGNPLTGWPERLPLRLLGDGAARFPDRGPLQVSLGGAASARDLGARIGHAVDVRRFRLNLILEGGEPWEEFGWTGARLRLGGVELDVTAPLQRCNAVNASPEGGGRDLDVVALLQREYGHLNFGIEARVVVGGRIAAGDAVHILAAPARVEG